MEERNNRRYQQSFIISNWKEFCSHKKNIVFPQGFNAFTNQQYEKFFIEKIEELTNDNHNLFYLFTDKLQENVRLIVQTLIDSRYQGQIEYEYQSLYLGNKKQLLVYVPHPQIISYLEKYRLPNLFNDYKQALHLKDEQIDQSIIQRNLAISLDKPLQQIQIITNKIQACKDQSYTDCIGKFSNLMNSILEDFNRQHKRKQILLISTRYSTMDIIYQLCRQHELYFTRRFIDGAKNQKYVDMIISKNSASKKQVQDFQEEQQIEEHQPERLGQPKPLYKYEMQKINHCKASCRVFIPSYGKLNKIEQISVENQKGELQKFSISENTQQVMIELQAYRVGTCKFILNSENSVGKSIDPIQLKIYFDSQSQSVSRTLYILGKSQKGLIPIGLQQEQSKLRNQTTNNNFLKSYSVLDASVENCFMVCDQNGNVANWGQAYTFKEKKQNELTLPLKDFTYNCTIEKPFHMDQVKFIRKVSCGSDYYLLCDRLGRTFSHGHNICAQLGIGQPDPNQNTQSPIQITKLKKNFIVDVIATKWGASFAIDQYGSIFKWGAYQIAITEKPIRDLFGSVINYQLNGDIFQQFPIPIEKKYISQPVKQIHSGFQFTYSLTVDGRLYGWGDIKYLGIGQKQDNQHNKIFSICNPLLIMKEVKQISTNSQHTVVVKTDGSVWGWGNKKYLDGSQEKNQTLPIKIIEKLEKSGKIICGSTYTVKIEHNAMKIINNNNNFNSDQYQVPGSVFKAFCQQNLISILVSPTNSQ